MVQRKEIFSWISFTVVFEFSMWSSRLQGAIVLSIRSPNDKSIFLSHSWEIFKFRAVSHAFCRYETLTSWALNTPPISMMVTFWSTSVLCRVEHNIVRFHRLLKIWIITFIVTISHNMLFLNIHLLLLWVGTSRYRSKFTWQPSHAVVHLHLSLIVCVIYIDESSWWLHAALGTFFFLFCRKVTLPQRSEKLCVVSRILYRLHELAWYDVCRWRDNLIWKCVSLQGLHRDYLQRLLTRLQLYEGWYRVFQIFLLSSFLDGLFY